MGIPITILLMLKSNLAHVATLKFMVRGGSHTRAFARSRSPSRNLLALAPKKAKSLLKGNGVKCSATKMLRLRSYHICKTILLQKLFFRKKILLQKYSSMKTLKPFAPWPKLKSLDFLKFHPRLFGNSDNDSLDAKIKSGTRRDAKIHGPWGVPHESICALSLDRRKLAGFGCRKGKIASDRKNGLALSTRQDQTLPLFFFKLK